MDQFDKDKKLSSGDTVTEEKLETNSTKQTSFKTSWHSVPIYPRNVSKSALWFFLGQVKCDGDGGGCH